MLNLYMNFLRFSCFNHEGYKIKFWCFTIIYNILCVTHLDRVVQFFLQIQFEREESLMAKNRRLNLTVENERKRLGRLQRKKEILRTKCQHMHREKLELEDRLSQEKHELRALLQNMYREKLELQEENYNLKQMIKSDVDAFKNILPNIIDSWGNFFRRIMKYNALAESNAPRTTVYDTSDNSAMDKEPSPSILRNDSTDDQNKLYSSPSLLSRSSFHSEQESIDSLNLPKRLETIREHEFEEDTEGILPASPPQSEGSSTEERTELDCSYLSEMNENSSSDSVESTLKIPLPRRSSRISKINNNSSISNTGESDDSTMISPPCTKDPYEHEADNKLSEEKDAHKRGIDSDDQSEEHNLKKVCDSNESVQDVQRKRRKCTICEKTLASTSSLWHHMKIHKNDKPYKCSFCERTFRTKWDLKSHIRIHTGEQPFKCTICSKSFRNRAGLRSHHLHWHTDERPLSCAICLKGFVQKCNLIMHIRRHHPE